MEENDQTLQAYFLIFFQGYLKLPDAGMVYSYRLLKVLSETFLPVKASPAAVTAIAPEQRLPGKARPPSAISSHDAFLVPREERLPQAFHLLNLTNSENYNSQTRSFQLSRLAVQVSRNSQESLAIPGGLPGQLRGLSIAQDQADQ